MVKRDKRRADHGDSVVRGRLLAAATELFTIKGYAATSVREIVEAAGVSKPVLYYWFGNKEGIYLELMTEPFGRFTALLEECLGTAGSPCGRLVDLLDRTLMLVRENLGGTRLMYSIYYGPPQGAPFVDFEGYHRHFQDAIRELVFGGIEAGELRSEKVDDMMWILLGVFNVALEEQLCGRPDRPPGIDREGLRRMLTLVLNGFAARTADEVER